MRQRTDVQWLDWQEVGQGPPPSRARPGAGRGRLRAVVVASVILGLLGAPLTMAGTGDPLREGARNGTATRETQIIASHAGAATRQSNVGSGPAAIYGCRRQAAECTRHVNLRDGPAAAFVTRGRVPFTVGSSDGVVPNLNADKVDGLDAAQLRGQPGQRGPAGPAGPTGPAGSPDTPAQVLAKLREVDGAGSGLDADALDGLDASAFVRGPGAVLAGRVQPPKETLTRLLTAPGLLELSIRCEDGANNTRYEVRNLASSTLLFFDGDGMPQLAPGAVHQVALDGTGPWQVTIVAAAGTGEALRAATATIAVQNTTGANPVCRAFGTGTATG